MIGPRHAAFLAFALTLHGVAHAQPAPALRVTASLQTPAQLRIGATLQLQLEVMTPTWFTQPPRLPALELPGVMVTPPPGQGELVRDTAGGVSYSGLRYTYVISPTAAGTVQVPPLTVTAQVGPHGETATGTSQPLSFSVAAPSAADEPGMVTGQLTVSQDYTLAPDPLVVGGRITRSITQRAQGVQALMLPAVALPDVPGFKRYPREAEVTPLDDGRGHFIGGQRIDRADYVAEQAGAYELPPITVHWRDGATGQPARMELPGRAFTVAPAPAVTPPFSLADDLARLRHGLRWVIPAAWLAWGGGLLLAAVAVWLTWPRWRRLARTLRQRAEQAAARRRASESWHWRAWQRDARRGAATLDTFYRWLRLAAGARDLRGAVAPLGEAARRTAADTLRGAYGAPSADAAWRPALVRASRSWRQTWRTRHAPAARYSLPGALNPAAPAEPASRQGRRGGGHAGSE